MLTGSMVAMVTPMNERGAVDWPALEGLVEHHISQGTDGIVSVGTTGESATLDHEEHGEVISRTVQAVAGRIPVIGGTGANSTSEAIALTQHAMDAGVDACLLVVPYYNKPPQEGLYQHFKAVSKATSLPIMLYNIPSRTGRNLEPETVARLAEIPTITSIKESAGSVDQLIKLKSLVPDDFLIYSGDDALTLPFLEEGASGVVSVASHCAGMLVFEMVSAFKSGDLDMAKRHHDLLMPLFDVLFITSNPAPVKAAMTMMGFHVGKLRLPLVDVTKEERLEIQTVLRDLKLIL